MSANMKKCAPDDADASEQFTMSRVLTSLYRHINTQRKRQLLVLLGLMLLGGVSELVTIGAIVPLLATLADPDLTNLQYGAEILSWLDTRGLQDVAAIKLALIVAFCVAVATAGTVRLALLYMTSEFNFGLAHDFTVAVFRNTLERPYLEHVNRNSSETVAALSKVDGVADSSTIETLHRLLTSLPRFR